MQCANIYLDYNSTTPAEKEVISLVEDIYALPLNPSSIHAFGGLARKMIEDARENILVKLNAKGSYNLVFTASGTEANNLAILGTNYETFLCSAIEHASILNILDNKEIIKVDINGIVDLEDLEQKISKCEKPFLVSVMMANNETGVIEPIKEITKIVHKYNGIMHTDAVCACGKIEINIEDLGVDLITIAAHKIGGIQGSAALIYKKNIELKAQIKGGGQERKVRSGTENVASICGFSKALDVVITNLANYNLHTGSLIAKIENYVNNNANDAIIFSSGAPRLSNTTYISMPNVSAEAQLIQFDLESIAVSSGSACSSGKVSSSHVLKAFGIEERLAANAIRISVGMQTKPKEIERFCEAWYGIYLKNNKEFKEI